jgi:hypothetical protein
VSAVASGPKLSHGVVTGVSSSGWTTVTLGHTYADMVVIATPNYDSADGAGVARIQNATGNSFDVRVDPAGGAALSGVTVHYVVVEAGVYDAPGFKMEAAKFISTRTDENNSWVGESRGYLQSYSNPVVVGQVMSYNDARWSVFWARGDDRKSPPTSGALYVGKHVGEDSDTARVNETIGYIVLETSTSGTAEIEGLRYVAALGGDTIKGVGDAPAYTYSYAAMPNSKTAVASQAAMDGGNGGWAVLYGDNPITSTGTTLKLAIDEDQANDSERKHTSEQVAYLIIDPPAGMPSARGSDLDTKWPSAVLRQTESTVAPIRSFSPRGEGGRRPDEGAIRGSTQTTNVLLVTHLLHEQPGEAVVAATARHAVEPGTLDALFEFLAEDEFDALLEDDLLAVLT